ncbi:MAG TPA: DUF1850 domain-containing protein [Firmicutes bacterium]|nr:DUF1850 domain-containing protein [Bacillota bacterium]
MKRSLYLLALVLFCGYLLQPVTCLLVNEVESGKILVVQRVEKGEEFTLIYTHSVHKSPVVEVFSVDPELGLVLKKTGFRDYGVGIPYSTPYDFNMDKDDFFWIENINEPLGSFTMRVQEIPNQRLVFGEKIINLLDKTRSGTLVRVEPVSGSRLKLWLKERF